MQHVFHWLVYHNDLFGTNIPLSTLLQAVQQSTVDFLSRDADQLHDFEGLRERCGCLIMVEQEKLRDHQNTVSFAHYTVKEYLQSPRISQKKVGFFALAHERIQKQFAGIALRQALAIQPDKLPGYAERAELPGYGVIYGLLDADFKLYCGISSVLQLNIWPETISSDSTLMELSEALVNPHRPTHEDLCTLLSMAYGAVDLTVKSDLYYQFQFWSITGMQNSDPNAAVFLSFLVTSSFSDKTHLALAFARKHSMLIVLTQQLHITKEVWRVVDYDRTDSYDIVGSIPEIVAQWASNQPKTFSFILDLISEYGVTHFDLSTLLLLYIGCHTEESCSKPCSLERLLNLGASAKGPEEAFVTPLQIAAVCWDLHGIETLLNAGADPNALGGNGTGWAPNSLMERFNYLHGASSLHIIKQFECIYRRRKGGLGLDETTRERIERRLLESGAVEIELDGWEPGSDDVFDEGGDSENHSST